MIDKSSLCKYNKNNKFILTVVDVGYSSALASTLASALRLVFAFRLVLRFVSRLALILPSSPDESQKRE